MQKEIIRIASRNSPLAMKQAEMIKTRLLQHHSHLDVTIIGMTTEGDRRLGIPLASIGGKGLFVKELEQAMFEDRADIAVHSTKDVPVELPDGLTIQTICEREDPRDVFVSNQHKDLFSMPSGTTIGTSSLRRQALLANLRPDIDVLTLRGNVQTRLKKLDNGEYDAIILAAAGLNRLGMADRIRHLLNPAWFIPAVGQGILSIECREDDKRVKALLAPLNHQDTAYCVTAERAMNRALNGGCQVPIAAYATLRSDKHGDKLYLRGLVGKPDGTLLLQATTVGNPSQAEALGEALAAQLRQQGADRLLAEVYAEYGK